MDVQAFNHQIADNNLQLAKSYLFTGKNQFLLEDSATQLVCFAKKQGFNQRDIFYINNKSKFQVIEAALSSPGLFDPIAIIEIRLETEKPSKKIGEQLTRIAQHSSQNIVIIQAPNLDYKIQKEAWYQTLVKITQSVIAHPITTNQLANWIFSQSKQLGLDLSSESINLIKDSSEGNLLWANQILLQLSNSEKNKQIEVDTVNQLLTDMSVFQIEDLLSTLFNKNTKALKILEKMAQENQSLVYLTAILSKDLLTLNEIINSHLPFDKACQQLSVWKSKQAYFRAANSHYNQEHVHHALTQIAQLDKLNKGQAKGDAWLTINQLVADLLFDGYQLATD